jgi:hypothetical protein
MIAPSERDRDPKACPGDGCWTGEPARNAQCQQAPAGEARDDQASPRQQFAEEQ